MTLTVSRLVFACLALLALCPPVEAATPNPARPKPTPTPHAGDRAAMYSPRVRRTTQNYLRLRLLELREADLDRARAVIEHRLDIKALLEDPKLPAEDARGRNTP
jgi:hypothetical protein